MAKRRGSCPASTTRSTARKTPGCVVGGQRVDGLVEQGVVGDPEQADGGLVGDALRPGAGEQLVEDRQRVAHRAAARADDEREHGRLDVDALGRAGLLEQAAQRRRRDEPERVVVGARPDRRQHLVGLRRREDEDEELRRLLDHLQQGVEALRGDHVRLVDDVDLVAAVHRREERALPQVAGVVDTTVAGGVDLDDVERAGAVGRQRDAGPADAARGGGGALLAVQRAGQDPRRRRLPAAARAAEEVGVVDPAAVDGVDQRRGDVLLPDHLGEGRRAVLPVQSEGHAARLRAPTDAPALKSRPGASRAERRRQYGAPRHRSRNRPPTSVLDSRAAATACRRAAASRVTADSSRSWRSAWLPWSPRSSSSRRRAATSRRPPRTTPSARPP